ncbi:hypothetical protein [Treponema sp.]|uniref:hypothetical protein n=1 Tax=Treponema sp. TaxID=166 RepID=UPI00298E383C|nr:hypothetical protein [Treponema sp.]MCR5613274.1 hypothetical protein [Treponema sp.]
MAMLSDFKKNKNPVQASTIGFLPRTVTIPLSQETGFECSSIVKAGDSVKEGQVIAEVSRDRYGTKAFGVAKIHSPIPGKVIGIKNCTYPNGLQGNAIEILLSGSFTYTGKKQSQFEWQNYSPAMLLRTISDSGVVNTFSNTFCSSFELEVNKIKDSENRRLFVRLFDEDPTCQTDSILTRNDFDKIAQGILITAKVSDATELIIAYAANEKLQNMFNIQQSDLFGPLPVTYLPLDVRGYPAGGKRELINAYKKLRKNSLPNSKIEKECLFTDSNTMMHVYNAVVMNIPVETVNVFVTGDCLQAKALLNVRIGTTLDSIAKQCGGFIKKLGRIIVNGEITGTAINSLDTPVTKYVKSITFTSETNHLDDCAEMCLRCGRCRHVCKSGLSPDIIYSSVIYGAEVEKIFIDSAALCNECGICSAFCPSHLPLTQIIKLVKNERQ